MRIRSILLGFLSGALVVASVTAAGAAISEKAAIKQVKAAAKIRLGLCKAALEAARATVLARVDGFDVAVRGGTFTTLGVQGLADDLAAFQTAVQNALFEVAVNTAADGKAALVELANGGTLATLPFALANVPGGLPEQVRASVAKLLAKTYGSVNKRLAKSSALVGGDGAATFFAAVQPPPQLHFGFTDQRSDAILFDFGIDLRISAGTTTPDTTRLWVGGTTIIGGVDLTVSAVALDETATTDDTPVTSVGRGRFLARLGDGVPLQRTNYLLGVVPVTTGSPGVAATSAFAVR